MADRLSAAGIERIHRAAASHVSSTGVPGLVALVAVGDQVHVESLGHLSIGGTPVGRDSLFRIASTTKPMTAAATLALVSEGLISLNEPVDRLLPELADRQVLRRMDGALRDTVPAARPITVRDLLTFTFGFGMSMEMFSAPTPWPIVEAAQALRLSTFGPPDPGEPLDPDTWIASLGTLPLLAQPGERWLYNTGSSVLGVLLARAAGASLADVLRTRIFEPLAMIDTGFFTTHTERLATAYRPTADGLVCWDEPDGKWSAAPNFSDGAGGLVSTADDLLSFARMLLRNGEPVLSRDAVRAMTSDQLTESQKASGGLGPDFFTDRSWGFGQAVYAGGTFGWDGGLGTSWLVDPNYDMTVIVLTQRMFDSPQTPKVHTDIQAAAYAARA
ncbi:MAG: hypothetical protein JWN95_4059 [Frankiales bacterium]|nr:hypothetical protein [Frankiales bacterium]